MTRLVFVTNLGQLAVPLAEHLLEIYPFEDVVRGDLFVRERALEAGV